MDWAEVVALKKKKHRLRLRMKRLVRKLVIWPESFRKNHELQTELRRVAALCSKLEERLHYRLEREFVNGVMES